MGFEVKDGRGIAAIPAPMSGSVPDMTASFKAKVEVRPEDQADAKRLGAVYDGMVDTLAQTGLNLPAIEAVRQYYAGLDTPGQPVCPLSYADFPIPMESGAVRLVIFLLKESARELSSLASAAAEDILTALPPGFVMHSSHPDNHHVTVFMTSQPSDPRPDPFVEGGGFVDGVGVIAAPKPAVMAKEIATYQALAAAAPPPELEVHSIVFANSGTLLLCFVEKTDVVVQLRQQMRGAFPGAAAKQPTILHCTLARILTPSALGSDEVTRIQLVCKRWTEKLRGFKFCPKVLWHVQESVFTTVTGTLKGLPFKEDSLQCCASPLKLETAHAADGMHCQMNGTVSAIS